jgi:hypothetical protein
MRAGSAAIFPRTMLRLQRVILRPVMFAGSRPVGKDATIAHAYPEGERRYFKSAGAQVDYLKPVDAQYEQNSTSWVSTSQKAMWVVQSAPPTTDRLTSNPTEESLQPSHSIQRRQRLLGHRRVDEDKGSTSKSPNFGRQLENATLPFYIWAVDIIHSARSLCS